MEKNNVTIEQVKDAIRNAYSDMKKTINNALEGHTDFEVYDYNCTIDRFSVSLAIYLDEDKTKVNNWNILGLGLEEDVFEPSKGSKFTSNIGTTGGFDLDDKSKGSRNNFYIQVGKVLGNENIMSTIKNAMITYGAAIREMREQMRNLREKEA